MKSNRKAKRMSRQRRAQGRAVPINIVSLIDIFAILVFYLLVNALVVEILPSARSLKLPESAIEEQPRQTTIVMVTTDDVLVGNERIMSTAEARAAETKFLPQLKSALLAAAPLMRVEGDATQTTRGEVNIMADKAIPYSVLKKVMATTTETRFAKISLAVIEKKGLQP
ncbi:MAG TPA: biopolymer transporter ExbD [Solimonas sp.]|nr:biopolymer transporter ExbD [Solimonas sp.]